MPGAQHRDLPEHLPFPALDPELSPSGMMRRRLRNLGLAAVAIAILAGLGGLATYLVHALAAPGGGRHAAARQGARTLPAASAPAGTVLSQTPRGALTLSGLRGQRPTVLMSLPRQVYVSATADNRYLVTTNGLLLSVGPGDHLTTTRLKDVSFSTWSAGGPEPLADGDRYLALQDFNTSNSPADGSPIAIRALSTGRSRSLGTGDLMSADPAAAGVITSLPAPVVATSTASSAPSNGGWPDGKVVLRDAGRKDVLLGTATQLKADVHLPAATPVYLFPAPDPAGDKIAIVVEPEVGQSLAGVVVVSRTGRVLYALSGAGLHVSASWSQSGESLAMPAQVAHGSVLHIWNASGRTSVQRFPGRGEYGGCSWSPDGAWILCEVGGPHASGEQWAVASASGGPMVITTGPGYPIAWLARGPGA